MVWVVGIGIGLLLLFAFPRQMGAVILFLVVGAGVLFGFIYNAEQQRAEEHRKKIESITISAAYDPGCEAAFPILISIRNGYTQTIQTLTFELGGYREGYSSPVYRGLSYKSDRIITPGQTYTACWTQPGLDYGAQEAPAASLTWRASYSYATFSNGP
jgi:hypothetical protein